MRTMISEGNISISSGADVPVAEFTKVTGQLHTNLESNSLIDNTHKDG